MVELQNQYGERMCVLEEDGNGYYRIPDGENHYFDVGDVLTIVEVED